MRIQAGLGTCRGIVFWALVWLDVFAGTFPERQRTCLLDQFVSACPGFAQQHRQQVQTIRPFALSQSLSRKRSKRGEEIDLANQRIGYTRPDPVRPAGNERNPGASLERAIFASAQRSGRAMAIQFLDRLVLV